jgi:hypothetical protein
MEKALSSKPIYIHLEHEYGSGEVTFRGVNKTVTTYLAGGKEYGSLDEVIASAMGGEMSSEDEDLGSDEEASDEDSGSDESSECNRYCGLAGYVQGSCVDDCPEHNINLGSGSGMGCPNSAFPICCCEDSASSPPTGNLLLAQDSPTDSGEDDEGGEAEKETSGKYATCLDKDRPSREIKLTEKDLH